MIRMSIILLLTLSPLFSIQASEINRDAGWPRSFTNADGSVTTIAKKPARILSTTVTVTGTLLAIDAPVIASATASDGLFFTQWDAVARQRQVEKLWQVGAVDIEMAYSVMPDLIVVSSVGADSVIDQVSELQQLAPVIIVDYGGQTWQQLAQELGHATGREAVVQEKIDQFNHYVDSIKLPLTTNQANIIAYNGPGSVNSIAKLAAPHSELIHALGFEIEGAANEWEIFDVQRNDFARVHYETLTYLKAPITFIIAAEASSADAMLADPVLANLPSVRKKQVYSLGVNSFRIDYFSSLEIIALLQQYFGQQP